MRCDRFTLEYWEIYIAKATKNYMNDIIVVDNFIGIYRKKLTYPNKT